MRKQAWFLLDPVLSCARFLPCLPFFNLLCLFCFVFLPRFILFCFFFLSERDFLPRPICANKRDPCSCPFLCALLYLLPCLHLCFVFFCICVRVVFVFFDFWAISFLDRFAQTNVTPAPFLSCAFVLHLFVFLLSLHLFLQLLFSLRIGIRVCVFSFCAISFLIRLAQTNVTPAPVLSCARCSPFLPFLHFCFACFALFATLFFLCSSL